MALGTDEYMQAFVSDKVKQWVSELEQLAIIACSQPNPAYAAFTHGMTSKWTYFTRTMPNIASNLLLLELTIRTKLIPVLTSRPPPNDLERDLLSLPARFGGITLINPARITDIEFLSSAKITEALKNVILEQEFRYTGEVIAEQLEAKSEIKK